MLLSRCCHSQHEVVLLLDLDGGNKQKDGGKLDFDSATARLLDLIDGHQEVI